MKCCGSKLLALGITQNIGECGKKFIAGNVTVYTFEYQVNNLWFINPYPANVENMVSS